MIELDYCVYKIEIFITLGCFNVDTHAFSLLVL